MYRLIALLVLLHFSANAAAATIAITNVTIVDVGTGDTRPAQTVLVRGRDISAVGSVRTLRVPPRARKVDGRGRFLMLGLWDMGNFLLDGIKESSPGGLGLSLAHGVVGTRDLGTAREPAGIAALERSIASSAVLGPKLIWTTKVLGSSAVRKVDPEEVDVHDDLTATKAVDNAAAAGAHYIRVVQNLPEGRLPAVIRAARRHRLPVFGNFVSSWRAASQEGVTGFDHFVDLYRSTAQLPLREDFLRLHRDAEFRRSRVNARDSWYAFFATLRARRDEAYYRSTIKALAAARTPVTTDMASGLWAKEENKRIHSARVRYAFPGPPLPPPPPSMLDGSARNGLWSDLRDLRDAGVTILAGTQADGSATEIFGATLQDELVLLVRAGFTPREALATATLNPAETIARHFPRVRAARAIAPGQPADLLLLEGNPLLDIANVRRIYGVVANGYWIGPRDRQRLLNQAAALAAQKQ